MRCFNVTSVGARPGIRIEKTPYPHVAVGEAGRGRRLTKVALGSRDFPEPPEAIDRVSVMRTRKGGLLAVAERPGDDKRALVLLAVEAGYRGGTTIDTGEVIFLAEGYVAQGAAGRMGGHAELLVVMSPGQQIKVRRQGRLYGAPDTIVVTYDGEDLHAGPPDEVCHPGLDDDDGELI